MRTADDERRGIGGGRRSDGGRAVDERWTKTQCMKRMMHVRVWMIHVESPLRRNPVKMFPKFSCLLENLETSPMIN